MREAGIKDKRERYLFEMSFRESTLRFAEMPKPAIEYVLGRRKCSCFSITNLTPDLVHSFPPAFMPIWRETGGMSMLGLWKDWFGNRPLSYVRLSRVNDYRVREFGRSYEQLVAVVLLQEICASEGITDEIRCFSRDNGFDHLEDIDPISLDTGDDVLGLSKLPFFKGLAPLEVVSDHHCYNGFFPTDLSAFGNLKNSSLEYSNSEFERILTEGYAPEWYLEKKVEEKFYHLVDQGALSEAWAVLNCSGWSYSQAKNALKRLAETASNDCFSAFAEDWAGLPHSEFGQY